MTPLYDIMSAYPAMGHGDGRIPPEKLKLAMAFTGKSRHYEWNKIGLGHFRETAKLCGFQGVIENLITDVIEKVPQAVTMVSAELPQGFPDNVAVPVLEGLLRAAKQLQKTLPRIT